MSKHIKEKQQQIKVSAAVHSCPAYPSFSFQFLTHNKEFNLEYLNKKDKSEREKWLAALVKREVELSQIEWRELSNMGKNAGFETIESNRLRFSPHQYTITDDQKVIIFRFNSGNGRLIGIRTGSCSTFYVIGIDFDFSAYDHGS